jgi:hypothetical protein
MEIQEVQSRGGDGDILDNISGTAARIRSNQAAMESPAH